MCTYWQLKHCVHRYGNSALHYAVAGDNSDVVKLLLDTAAKYGIPTDAENQFGMTPLAQAAESQHDRCVCVLRQASGAKDSIAMSSSSESLAEQQTSTHGMTNGFDVSLSNGRPISGPLLVRRQRSHAGRLSNGNAKELVATSLPVNGGYAGRLIRAASVTNLRNQPEYILQLSPRRCFAGEHPCNPLPPSTAADNPDENDADNWRRQLKQLYATYGYQFAPSYRKGAPPIDRTLYVDDEFGIPRPVSPNVSESDVISELSKRMSRRGSVASGKIDAPRARRNSIMGMRNGRTSSNAESCSESESSSYAYKGGRKSAASDDGTMSDKSSKHGKLDKAKSRSRKISAGDKKSTDEHPARPSSRTGHHAKDVGSRAGHHAKDAIGRVGHHGKDAGTNMNAVADQLGAIKEYQE